MILFGIILILVAAAVGTILFIGTAAATSTVSIGVPGGTLVLPPLLLLLTGAGIVIVLWLGWVFLLAGVRRSRRLRQEAKENARLAEEHRQQQEREMQQGFAEREAALAEERRRAEAQAQALRQEADSRAAEQNQAIETAEHRATQAERKLAETQEKPPS